MAKSKDMEKSESEPRQPRAAGIATRANAILAGAVALTLGVGFAAGYGVASVDDGRYDGPEARGPVQQLDGNGPGAQQGPGGGTSRGPQGPGGQGGPGGHGGGGGQGGPGGFGGQHGPGGQR